MLPPGHAIQLRSTARSHQGRVRHNNEDSVLLWNRDPYLLAAVADGMGGAAGGEEASRVAVESISEIFLKRFENHKNDLASIQQLELGRFLVDSVQQANFRIHRRATDNEHLRGMGTTLTMAFIRSMDVIVTHIGDSRAYLIDGQARTIAQLTTDHSFVQALVDAGHITDDEAELHPMRNVLYRALGQPGEVDIDTLLDIRLQIGDRLVLCSDGLTLHLSPEEIGRISLRSDNPDAIADRLIARALERGGRDNISVIVIVAESVPEQITQSSEEGLLPADHSEGEDGTLIERDHPARLNLSPDGKQSGNGRNTGDTTDEHDPSYGEGIDRRHAPH